jgi:predicted Zn finger-like uncharacterized protein
MYTQCPKCLTIFQIDEDALQASLGIVQCGHCTQRFDALRTLSDTLPREPNAPLGELDPTERVPTLTESIPSSATERATHTGAGEVAAPTGASHPESAAPASDAQAVSVEITVTGSAQPVGGVSDWFADFETELTSSLIADASRAGLDDADGDDNAWQVVDLPAQRDFSGPDLPGSFAGFPTGDAELADQAAWCASLDDAGALVGGAPRVPAPEYPAPGGEGDELFAGDVVAPGPEELGASPADGTDMQPPDEAEEAANDPATPAASESGPSPAVPDAALPASMFLVHEAGNIGDATAPDAVPTVVEPAPAEASPPAEEAAPSEEAARAEVISDPAEPLPPVYVRPRRRRSAGVAWALGCLALVVVLAAQLAWIKRVDLFQNPATHGWTARACQVIACRLPPIPDVAKLELVSRDVRPDPQVAGALTITATLRNDAHFRQPWPVVVVELSDLDNNPVAMRRFRPAEYMPDPARRAAGIAPGATSAIAFEVVDPGRRAVSFQFGFE